MSEQSAGMIRFIRGLRAVREYTPEPIEDDVINDLLDVARWSGSGHNAQALEVVVVRDPAMKQQLAENGARPAGGAAVAIVVVVPADAAGHDSVFDNHHDTMVFDNGRLVERMLLTAKAHGLGGNIATLKGEGPVVIAKALGIPADKRVWTVVTIGHTDQEARRRRLAESSGQRRTVEDFTHYERY